MGTKTNFRNMNFVTTCFLQDDAPFQFQIGLNTWSQRGATRLDISI
jgi:hypothetical protein